MPDLNFKIRIILANGHVFELYSGINKAFVSLMAFVHCAQIVGGCFI